MKLPKSVYILAAQVPGMRGVFPVRAKRHMNSVTWFLVVKQPY